MILSILFILKTILYMNITKVEFNQLAIFLITCMITLLIISLIDQSRFKYKNGIIIVFYSLVSFIMFVDVIYYMQFASLPSVAMLSQTKQLTAVGDSIKYLVDIKNLLLILDIPILILILLYKADKIKFSISKKVRSYIILGILALTVIYVNVTDQNQSVKAQEFYSFHAIDVANNINKVFSKEVNTRLTEEDINELKNRTEIQEGKLSSLGKDRNLIVLQVESLQNFVINMEYEGQEVTPNLNKLINDSSSVYYDKYYQLIGRGNTSDAEFVSHNSIYPSMEEPSYVQYENNKFHGLPWMLRDNGYTTWAMHGYKKEFWNREKAYVAQGFQRFVSEEDYQFEDTIGFGLRDEDFLKQSTEYIKELDSIDENPFYAFLITLTSHAPYKMSEEYHGLNLNEEHSDTLLGNYLQAIHYTDKYIGEFIENLKEMGIYEESVIALYGDHFAISSTQKEVQDMMSQFLGQPYDFDSMMNVPLIINIPGETIKETISTVGSPLDFYPTIMNIMGYKNEKGLIFGRDLTNYTGNNFVAPQTYMLKGSFIDKDTLFVVSRDGIFEHSRAINIKTGEELEVEQFREQYERATEEINKSEFILKKDVLGIYMENQGQINLSQLEDVQIENKEFIKTGDYGSIEDLEEDYNKGYRLLAVTLEWEDEQKIIIKNNISKMTIADLAKWAREKEDVYIVLRTMEEDEDIFVKLKEEYEEFRYRFIPEIKYFYHYIPVSYMGFKNVILDIRSENYNENEIIDFLNRYPHFGVTIAEFQLQSDLVKKISELGVNSYLDNITNERELKKIQRKGIFGGFIK
ncbi:sulfatase-like hydrolase/transferase [Tissierella sp. MB52-C2]|uniref:sulfatase-like hydrolase/transferase n=1 Tax=Tissierella sp. MB52-C2 TaxID=3070999 RepID=UPI00280B793B|nr:sulfatase-like hydrolase/transferase [Tissierella sp. MB52-C2]WMM24342.1 sulfatase-like hydrolase/transferase [Tissierella sp. MB52-C2]